MFNREILLSCLHQANCSYAIKASLQETGLSGVLAQMKLNATAINASTAALQASVDGLYVVTFPQLKSTLTPLFDSVRTARNSAHSGFVGVSYIQFKTTMCSSFLGSFTMLALCSLAIGVLNFVVIVTATVLAKRMPFPKQADEPELVAELAELSVDSSVGASASARPSSEFSPTALASAVTAVNHRQAPPSSSSAVASSIGGAQFNHGLARQSIIAASPPPLSLARKPVRGGALEM